MSPGCVSGSDSHLEARIADLQHACSLALGVAVVVAGNICVSIALNVQKLAHLRSDPGGSNARQQDTDEEAGERSLLLPDGQADGRAGGQDGRQKNARSGGDSAARPYWRMPLWWIGVTTMAVGELGNFIVSQLLPDPGTSTEHDVHRRTRLRPRPSLLYVCETSFGLCGHLLISFAATRDSRTREQLLRGTMGPWRDLRQKRLDGRRPRHHRGGRRSVVCPTWRA